MRTINQNQHKGKLLKVGEVAAQLHVSPQTVRDWTEAGKLEATIHQDSTHRLYYEADVNRTFLENKEITSYLTVSIIVGLNAKDETFLLHPETYLPTKTPLIHATPFIKFWNYTNGLQKQPHQVALNQPNPIVLEPKVSDAYLTVSPTGEPLISTTVTIVGLEEKTCLALLPSALEDTKQWLQKNFIPEPTIMWKTLTGETIQN